MARIKNKKGQTEDIFSDLIPAFVIFIIALVVITQVGKGESFFLGLGAGEIRATEMPLVDRILPLVLLRTPFNATKAGFQNMDFIDFMNELHKIKKSDTTQINKLKEAKIAETFNLDMLTHMSLHRDFSFKCSEEMYKFISDNFRIVNNNVVEDAIAISNYPTWVVSVYSEEDKKKDADIGLVFICSGQMYEFTNNKLVKKEKGCYSFDAFNLEDIFFYGGFLGWNYPNLILRNSMYEEMFSTEFRVPTEDPKMDLIVVIDYSRLECPSIKKK